MFRAKVESGMLRLILLSGRVSRLRNEVERLFRMLKGFRRIFTRYDKLDVVFVSCIYFALVVAALRSVNTPRRRSCAA